MLGTSKKERRQPTRAAAAAVKPPTADNDYISRRIKRHLNDLERTNYTEPTMSLSGYNVAPEEKEPVPGSSTIGDNTGKTRRKQTNNVRTLLLYRKTTQALIDEASTSSRSAQAASYLSAASQPSKYPPLLLCSVCGYRGKYTCQRCGMKWCDLGCKGIHDESRCERR